MVKTHELPIFPSNIKKKNIHWVLATYANKKDKKLKQ
jgi:hypothetical protein